MTRTLCHDSWCAQCRWGKMAWYPLPFQWTSIRIKCHNKANTPRHASQLLIRRKQAPWCCDCAETCSIDAQLFKIDWFLIMLMAIFRYMNEQLYTSLLFHNVLPSWWQMGNGTHKTFSLVPKPKSKCLLNIQKLTNLFDSVNIQLLKNAWTSIIKHPQLTILSFWRASNSKSVMNRNINKMSAENFINYLESNLHKLRDHFDKTNIKSSYTNNTQTYTSMWIKDKN